MKAAQLGGAAPPNCLTLHLASPYACGGDGSQRHLPLPTGPIKKKGEKKKALLKPSYLSAILHC